MSDESKARLVEALGKVGLGALVCGVLAMQIWIGHNSSLDMNDRVERLIEQRNIIAERQVQAIEKGAQAIVDAETRRKGH